VAAAPKLSLTESSGKLLNYMAVALPTVAYDTPVAREYLGSDGFFAACGDVEGLAAQLKAALFPPAEAAHGPVAAGYRLRQRAIHQFEWRQTALTIVESYAALVDPHHLRPVSPSALATRR
jgi:glycosyltransferase involved in cell wall biosynthesis